MQVAKWGNSLAVRLPAELVVEALGLKEGDEIEIVTRLGSSGWKSSAGKARTAIEELLLGFARDTAVRLPGNFKLRSARSQ